jgi:hypothetical protein
VDEFGSGKKLTLKCQLPFLLVVVGTQERKKILLESTVWNICSVTSSCEINNFKEISAHSLRL